MMSAQRLEEVRRFLAGLEIIQQQFATHLEQKTIALKSADRPQLLQLAEVEKTLVAQLQQHLMVRGDILQRAKQFGLPADSLEKLTESIAGTEWESFKESIDRARTMTQLLRRQSWIHWVMAHRAFTNYGELLSLIANGGQGSLTYDDQTTRSSTRGGTLLDASI